ncbi:hypothetical protein [Brachybacterium vulturis]|uniref:hypothetical protein n=1 Tax=Brachybacterium vulturis TaxID=2017484 RepID=UPI003736E01B
MTTTKLRKRDTGEQGNGGQFATTTRHDVAVQVPESSARGRDVVVSPGLRYLTEHVEARFDTEGRTVVSIQINRDQLPTSGYRQGSAPWEVRDEDVSDEQVDAYLEACSDDPEAFGADLGFPGEARWISASSTLELTHTGYEGVSDEEFSSTVSATLGDFRNDLRLHEWG